MNRQALTSADLIIDSDLKQEISEYLSELKKSTEHDQEDTQQESSTSFSC